MLSAVTTHRRFLHQIPELGFDLSQTIMLVTGVLRGYRCDYFSPLPGCVYAWFDFGKDETVAVRADMDGLPVEEATGLPYSSRNPGRMHACGHDGHTAMALDLCQWLSERPSGLARNVLVIFQPSEETAEGAKQVCEAGLLQRYHVTRVFGMHLWPGVPKATIVTRPGPMMSRSSDVNVSVRGRSVHLSRVEEEGQDALAAAAEFIMRTYSMLESVPRPRVLRFGKMNSGVVRNAVSGGAALEGSMRTYSEETYQECKRILERTADAVGASTRCAFQVSVGGGCPAVWNNEELYEAVRKGLGDDAPGLLEEPVMASEDFSYYQKEVPGVFFFLGTGDTPEIHAPNFDFDDEAILPVGAAFWRRVVQLP